MAGGRCASSKTPTTTRSRATSSSIRSLALPAKPDFGAGSMTKRIAHTSYGWYAKQFSELRGEETTAPLARQSASTGTAPMKNSKLSLPGRLDRQGAGGFGHGNWSGECSALPGSGDWRSPSRARSVRGDRIWRRQGDRKTYQMTKEQIVVGRGGRDYWTGFEARYPAGRFARTFSLAARPRERQVFPERPQPAGNHHQRREGPSSIEYVEGEKRTTAMWRCRCRRPRASAWRKYCTWNFEARPMVKAKLNCAGDSNPGRVRRNNEDAWHIDMERGIFLVVDGIGGQAAGEKAAEIALGRVRRTVGTADRHHRTTHPRSHRHGQQRDFPRGPGQPGVGGDGMRPHRGGAGEWLGGGGDTWAIRGLYQIRRGEIRKITHDHSPVGEREDSQELTEAEAMRHPRRNEVFRDVGSEEHQPDDPDFIEIRRIPFDSDSALLLCSDGLSDQVESADIRQVVERNAGKPQAAVRELIEAANRAGGKDNVTVLLVEGEQFTALSVGQALPPANPPVLPGMLSRFLTSAVFSAFFAVCWSLWPRPGFPDPQGAPAGDSANASRVLGRRERRALWHHLCGARPRRGPRDAGRGADRRVSRSS